MPFLEGPYGERRKDKNRFEIKIQYDLGIWYFIMVIPKYYATIINGGDIICFMYNTLNISA